MKIIISENQLTNLFVRRRMGEFEKYLKSAASWLDPKRHDGYDDYFTRVVFSSVRDFLADEGNLDYDTYNKLMDQVLPFMEKYVEKKYGDELRQYFDKEVNK
jgi:hypothetical protein